MEEFNGLKVPRPPTETLENYKGLSCAVGCGSPEDWEDCCPGILCDECIYHASNRKTLAAYLEDRKMETQHRGCKVPPGLNKDNAHVLNVANNDCAAIHNLNCSCYGILCKDCICDSSHRKELKELLKMWKEEDNPIKPGMVVRYQDTNWCLVWSVDVEGIRGWRITKSDVGTRPFLGFVVNVPYEAINKGYRLKNAGEYAIPDGQQINRLLTGYIEGWEEIEPPVLELTVEDIEKKYGRKVKIVGEHDVGK